MSKIDEELKELHFTVSMYDHKIHNMEYENTEDNRKVLLQWDDNEAECVLYCRDSELVYDNFGHPIEVSNGLDMVEMKVFLRKLEELRTTKYHVSVGVYANGQYVVNIVADEHLDSHIEYNKEYRFGRGLFVDGICVNQGYLSGEQVRNWTKRISEMEFDMSHVTYPYQ